MRHQRTIPIILAILLAYATDIAAQTDTRELSADIVRVLSKDLFDQNSIPFLQPMVEAFNATTNAGFAGRVKIPAEATLYVRVGLRGMAGLARDDQRTYAPSLPTAETTNDVASPIALIIASRVKEIFRRGLAEDSIQVPSSAATVLGFSETDFDLNGGYLLREVRKDPVYQQLVGLGLDSSVIDDIILQLPGALTLPTGADISTLFAVVPQIEVGALYGTELLVRYIPPITIDTNVGRFTFVGLGLRHSISQYLPPDIPIDLAASLTWQTTSLSNVVGVTGSQLAADATIISGGLLGSYDIDNISLYSSLTLESTEIEATYRYTLPRQLQAQLGLITPIDLNGDGRIEDDEFVPDPENGFPGDTKPQQSVVDLQTLTAKGTIGMSVEIGPVGLSLDYGLGSLDAFSIGLWGVIR